MKCKDCPNYSVDGCELEFAEIDDTNCLLRNLMWTILFDDEYDEGEGWKYGFPKQDA